jgi:CHAT domain-containing protein
MRQEYATALKFSQKAQLAVQSGKNYDSLYRWQWQSGRLYNSLGERENAKAAYRGAIVTLENLRHEIATANVDFQLDILEGSQPIYRELLSLLLSESENPNYEQIQEILTIRNQLELTALQEFFGDACLELQQAQSKTEKSLPSNVAKIHYILLKDNSYQILELPDGSFKVFSLGISKADLENRLMKWREMLLTSRIPKAYEPLSKELYTILMGQMAPFLPPGTEQLVFVGDGLLRNVPLAALIDRNKFLIEKYAIAYSLGLPLKTNPSRESHDSIAFGLSVGSDYFPPLPFVPVEINAVVDILQAREFLDSQFTEKSFKAQLQKKSRIIHVATHAIFSGSAQDSYFQAYDSLIPLKELEILLRTAEGLQLLFLSACKTAVGNERSVLGLAGVGARVGVPSIIASLWSVRDESTSNLVSDFYLSLRGGASDIDSLRQAQLKMLKLYPHPKFWSSFVLITNNRRMQDDLAFSR